MNKSLIAELESPVAPSQAGLNTYIDPGTIGVIAATTGVWVWSSTNTIYTGTHGIPK